MTPDVSTRISATDASPLQATAGESSRPAVKCPARRVLVVDDEPLVRWAVAETLNGHGYDVFEAGDAASARQLFSGSRTPPDLVLLDLLLPDSSDLGVLQFIRDASPTTAVILMTACGSPQVLADAARLGVRVLDKPFEMDALIPILEAELSVY